MEELRNIPPWVGSFPLWALFLTVVGTLIKTWPLIQKNLIDAKMLKAGGYAKRITELEDKLSNCEVKCDEREVLFKKEIDDLKQKLNNEAWQRVQSEISLVATLVQIVPNPMLGQILEALKRRSTTLQAVEMVAGPFADAAGDEA